MTIIILYFNAITIIFSAIQNQEKQDRQEKSKDTHKTGELLTLTFFANLLVPHNPANNFTQCKVEMSQLVMRIRRCHNQTLHSIQDMTV